MKYATIIFLLMALPLLGQPKISFSFDDGSLDDKPGYTNEQWNKLLLKKLANEGIEVLFFVNGRKKESTKGRELIESWGKKGHKIANHSFSHLNYNNTNTTIEDFKTDFIKNENFLKQFSNYSHYFRFPYLKEGNTKEKANAFRDFLQSKGYKNGYVTIDASDWYIDSNLVKQLRANPNTAISAFRDFYLKHIWERAQYYEKLSYELNNRHIKHTLLLHHNLTSALFIDHLINMFKEKGWEIVSASDAYKDPIFSKAPNYAGESLIYALAKDTGTYDELLRYPAEDSRYEKEKMDHLLDSLKTTSVNTKSMPYFGQSKPSLTPEIFAPDIISKANRHEFGCTFSKKADEFLFGVDAGSKSEIYSSKLVRGVWSTPELVFKDALYSYNDPMLTADEKQLFYISNKPKNDKQDKGDIDIWYSNREGNGWSAPINAGSTINSNLDEYYASFTNSGTLYFASKDKTNGAPDYAFDIYKSTLKDGQYQTPEKLPAAINTNRYEADVFIAPDESYMIFCAIRKGGLGRGDLFISFKNKEGNWTEAVNMGSTINTKNHELCPFVSKDGKYLFYTSNKDIYWVSAEILNKYKK